MPHGRGSSQTHTATESKRIDLDPRGPPPPCCLESASSDPAPGVDTSGEAFYQHFRVTFIPPPGMTPGGSAQRASAVTGADRCHDAAPPSGKRERIWPMIDDTTETPEAAEKFNYSEFPEDTLFHDRRGTYLRSPFPAKPAAESEPPRIPKSGGCGRSGAVGSIRPPSKSSTPTMSSSS